MSNDRLSKQDTYPPSFFAKLGQPCCSIWGKTEIEELASAYVRALAADGDEWKPLSKKRVRELLSEDEQGFARYFLSDDCYDEWFEAVRNQLSSSEGAFAVRGFWSPVFVLPEEEWRPMVEKSRG